MYKNEQKAGRFIGSMRPKSGRDAQQVLATCRLAGINVALAVGKPSDRFAPGVISMNRDTSHPFKHIDFSVGLDAFSTKNG